MNKKSRIALIMLITAALVLASVIPTLALNIFSPTCSAPWLSVENKSGEYDVWYELGSRELIIDGTIITSTCTGNIPLGEPFGKDIYLTTDEMRDYLCEVYGVDENGDPDPGHPACNIPTDPFRVDPNSNPLYAYLNTYKGETLTSIDWSLLVEEDVENYGDFTFVSEFDIGP